MSSDREPIMCLRIVLLMLPFIFMLSACGLSTPKDTVSCTLSECHAGIEEISENHKFACTECHEGNAESKDKDLAHAGMLGGRNPSDPAVWDKGCGKCHQYQHDRVNTTLMYTNTGMIKNIQQAWDDYEERLYSTAGSKGFDEEGEPVELRHVAELEDLSGELYRKFCSMCHVGFDKLLGYRAHHSSGCAACHFSHGIDGAYKGGDKTIQGKMHYPEKHIINPLPDDDVCLACHNRSGRLALSYRGEYDGNNSMVPTKDGIPGPELLDGIRNVRYMKPDIHQEAGMWCIDCHTSRDMMGDGYLYENMYKQVEVTCEDCHGTADSLPATAKITKENDAPLRESQHYAVKAEYGDEMALTSKGRMYSNVKKEDGKFVLYTKKEGKRLEIKTVKETADHSVYGHERMECYTCHSRTVIQCYGCHTTYDKSRTMTDWITMQETQGFFSETEDFRSFFPFPLAVNEKGNIAPMTPGCQTFVTILNEEGIKVLDDYIFDYKGSGKFKFVSFYGHNTGKKAVSCRKCHSDLMFAGFGQGLVSVKQKNITSSYLCDSCDDKRPLDSLYTMENGELNILASVVRDEARVLNAEEIGRMFDANRCIICHDKGDKKIYGKKINYEEILSNSDHRHLLSDIE